MEGGREGGEMEAVRERGREGGREEGSGSRRERGVRKFEHLQNI